MISQPGVRDEEGPDGMPALTLAIGHLDSDIVELLATPEVSDASPELLCDIMGELDKAIATEESTSTRNKMAKLRAVIMKCKIHRFCTREQHGVPASQRPPDELYDTE